VTKILIIDDDANFRRLVGAALRPGGHRLLEAERLSAAEAILSTERPDLVLVDRLLPDGDGTAWMATRNATLGIPFIFASAFRNGRGQLHPDANPAGFLRKPASPEAIATEVGRVLALTTPVSVASGGETEFEALRAEYCAELPARLAQIRRALEGVRRTPRDTTRFTAARTLVHELAGTAGSFGYDDLSVIGNRIEEALVAWQSWGGGAAEWAPVVAGARALAEWEDRISTPGAQA
jgi:CheY-like chemotaxis protein